MMSGSVLSKQCLKQCDPGNKKNVEVRKKKQTPSREKKWNKVILVSLSFNEYIKDQ